MNGTIFAIKCVAGLVLCVIAVCVIGGFGPAMMHRKPDDRG
jgi:hypothetical protein